jgi:hypothetical protein
LTKNLINISLKVEVKAKVVPMRSKEAHCGVELHFLLFLVQARAGGLSDSRFYLLVLSSGYSQNSRVVGCQNPFWTLWKGDKYFALTGNRTKVLRTTVLISFSISVLLRLIVVEEFEPMT